MFQREIQVGRTRKFFMALVAGTMPRRYGRYHKKTKKWISPSFWGVFAHMAYLPIGVARLMNSGPLLDFGALHLSQFGGKKSSAVLLAIRCTSGTSLYLNWRERNIPSAAFTLAEAKECGFSCSLGFSFLFRSVAKKQGNRPTAASQPDQISRAREAESSTCFGYLPRSREFKERKTP